MATAPANFVSSALQLLASLIVQLPPQTGSQHNTAANFVSGRFHALGSLILCGYSHAKWKKHAFYLHFQRLPLAFCEQLGYSAHRPGLFSFATLG
jgi:hypothetical protein